jgi:serine/threonine protein kinase
MAEVVHGWAVIKLLGAGGQGEVFLVRSPERTSNIGNAALTTQRVLRSAGAAGKKPIDELDEVHRFAAALAELNRADLPSELAALKKYKIPNGPDGEKAVERLTLEIESLSAISEPCLLKLMDSNVEQRWMITEFHGHGTLDDHQGRFLNRPAEALQLFAGLVEGVAALHKRGVIHRDIKPPNIFIAHDGRLVLGDFGIVFVEGGRNKRVTESFERVGTRDWMPPWAHTGMRVDDVRPSFDVYCLGKVLWSMLSGRAMLPFWWYDREPHDLTKMFPNTAAMKLINEEILSKCIVEHENECLRDAGALLKGVQGVLDAITVDGQQVGPNMRCMLCGRGAYKLQYPKEKTDRMLSVSPVPAPNFGTNVHTMLEVGNYLTVRVYACNHCGNIALFHYADRLEPAAWQTAKRQS